MATHPLSTLKTGQMPRKQLKNISAPSWENIKSLWPSYVVQKNKDIPVGVDPPTSYQTKQDKMIARTPHYTTEARQRNEGSQPCKEKLLPQSRARRMHMRPAQKSRNGCAAYQNLFTHFLLLGPNNEMSFLWQRLQRTRLSLLSAMPASSIAGILRDL